MDLQATRCLRRITRAHFVQTEQPPRRIIELVMVDLVGGERSVERELDVRVECCEFKHWKGESSNA